MFKNIKVGDVVTRMLAGTIPCFLKVTEVTEDKIKCGGWEFCRETGAEIDENLHWGPQFGITGSYLVQDNKTQ